MFEYKLQIGSMLIVAYYIAIFIKQTAGNKYVKCSTTYKMILAISPICIFFDGATAWTVNHLDIVHPLLNRLLHLGFYLSMDALCILIFYNMVFATLGRGTIKRNMLIAIPGLVLVTIVIAFIGQVYFVIGTTSNYSMGVSVIATYSCCVVYYLGLGITLFQSKHMIEKDKLISFYAFVVVAFALIGIQAQIPEALLSSILPAIGVIFIFENFENPYVSKLHMANKGMITGFATLVENRDNSTGGHIHRTQEYVEIIVNEMKKDPEYRKILNIDYIKMIMNAAPMHDLGKISTPDNILQKPGPLTDEEFAIMKQHAAIGGDIIKRTFLDVNDPEFIKIAFEVARYHHEKWDGSGYPEGLKGEEIPLHARVMAIADVFDAVSADRCYRPALPLDECFKIIEDGKGSHFDPKLATLFLNARKKVEAYHERIEQM